MNWSPKGSKMTTYDLQHLLATVEQVRAELHPDLPAGFLEGVVRAEDAHADDSDGALKAIDAAVVRAISGAEGDS